MHQIRVERYVECNDDVWRVECATCGIAADDLGVNQAAQVARVLASRICAKASRNGKGDPSGVGMHDLTFTDQQIIAMWAPRETPDVGCRIATTAPPNTATLLR